MKVRFPRPFLFLMQSVFFLGVVAAITYGLNRYAIGFSSKQPAYINYFQSYTVRTAVRSKNSPLMTLGIDKKELDDLAFATVTSVVNKKFDKLSSSFYGQPISYETNPLNVSIAFVLKKYDTDAKSVHVEAFVGRNFFYKSYLKAREEGKSVEDVFVGNKNVRAMLRPFDSYKIYADMSFSKAVKNKQELKEALDAYAREIVSAMAPELEQAAKVEAAVLKRLH